MNFSEKTEWSEFTEKEKKMTKNAVLLVGLLYKVCQVNLVLKSENENDVNKVNHERIDEVMNNANSILKDLENAV